MNNNEHQPSRRDFLKKAAYTAPVILTLTSVPAFATYGSNCRQGTGRVRQGTPRLYTQGTPRKFR
jgi:hypothetical protein